MKKTLREEQVLEKINEFENDELEIKTYKSGDMVLVKDTYNVGYRIEFVKHIATMECHLCQKKIYENVSIDHDKYPKTINFFPLNFINHIRKEHSDKIITFIKSKVNLCDNNCEFVVIKKVIL